MATNRRRNTTPYSTYGSVAYAPAYEDGNAVRSPRREEELRRAIFYLGGEEKRYIHVKVNEDSWLDGMIWLTPKGVNLAEGDIEDVGVVIDG